MIKKFENFGLLTSGFTFDESESDQIFRYRILNYFLLIGAITAALIGWLGEIGVMKIGEIMPRADFVYATLNVYLILKLRQSREHFTNIAWVEVSSLFILIVIALVTVETDEFRMVWFYIIAYFSYLLLNIFAGIFFTSLSIIAILAANQIIDLHLSETAIYTAIFGLIVIGIMSWASTTQINEYERLLMVQNKKLKRNVNKLDKALKQAEEANKIKSMFLANMSHEIRTPMNGMMTFAQVLRTTDLDKKQISYLNSIEQSGELLKTLIDDLLDLSSIEAGKLKITTKPVKMRSILDDVLLQVHPLFDKQTIYYDSTDDDEVKFTYQLNDNVPDYVVVDNVRLNQVIVNLISNARKFTKKGHVNLTIGGNMVADNSFNLHIEVSDTGVGIPRDKIDAIFETFHQLSEDRIHNTGIGLGLPISKKIIDAMSGAIQVQSTVGKGTKFLIDIVLPVAQYDTRKSAITDVPLHKITALLVEDDKISRFAVKTLLENKGHDVVIADNGKQALDLLKQKAVDVILMDVHMPELDGIEATKIIKQEKLTSAPVIGMTASVMQAERESYFEAGMDAFLEKPIHIDQLIGLIKRNLNG